MSTRALNWVWSLDELGPSETLVMLALADQANDDGVAWPAQGSLAKRARQTDRNVRRMLVRLQRMGLLSVERRSSTGGRRSNRYRLHVGAAVSGDGEDSLESRQPANLAGCEGVGDGEPVDNSEPGPVSVGVPATGQSVLLRKRTDCPVAQEDTAGRSQPDTDVRLLPIWEPPVEPPDQTGPEREVPGARDNGDDGPVGSGRDDPTSTGRSSQAVSEGGRLLVAECLPESMRALDAAGARRVVDLLEERVAAGWRPVDIRSVMDQPLPPRVGRLASLVASRLERNVDPAAAPLSGAGQQRLSEEARQERARRRSEELAGTSRRDDDELVRHAMEQVRRETPDAGRAEQARLAAELVQRWRQGQDGAAVGERGRAVS